MKETQEVWAAKKCKACEGADVKVFTEAEARDAAAELDGWQVKGREISKTFSFKDYGQTAAFVNAVVWIAHNENHHPEIEFGYKNCTVRYSTHKKNGITENDFICAAKINELF